MERDYALALAAAVTFGVASNARAASASLSPTAPSSNVLLSQLGFDPNYFSDGIKDGGRDFTDNSGPVGQTFTIGTGAVLRAVTVHGNRDSGGMDPGTNFHIRIGRVDPATRLITVLRDETAPEDNIPGDNDQYLTFTLANPVPVVPGELYSFSIYTESGWYGLAHSAADANPAWGPFNSNTSTQNLGTNSDGLGKNGGFGDYAAVNPNNYDFVFSLQGTVPEPGCVGLLGLGGVGLLVRRRRGA